MRYPYKEVKIVIEPQDSTARVHLLCDPMHYDGKKWIPNPVDTIYQITQKSYDEIIQSIRSIDFSRMINHFNTSGTDGTTYTLEYGNWQNTLKLSVWSPDFDTKKRKLEGFLFTCELILNAARLNSEEIL